MHIDWLGERFDHNSCDAVASASAMLRRWDFHARDLEKLESDSDGDENYNDPTNNDLEPDEEFAEDDAEEGSGEDGVEGSTQSARGT